MLIRWRPSGAGDGIMPGLHVDLAESHGGLARVAARKRVLGIVESGGDVHDAEGHERLARCRAPRWKPPQRGVELHDRAADVPVLQPGPVGRRHGVGRASMPEQPLGVGVTDDPGGADRGAVVEPDTLAGNISPTGTPAARTAPASRAASAIAKLTMPMPPRT